jgi:hypothetical protein
MEKVCKICLKLKEKGVSKGFVMIVNMKQIKRIWIEILRLSCEKYITLDLLPRNISEEMLNYQE